MRQATDGSLFSIEVMNATTLEDIHSGLSPSRLQEP